MVRQRLTDNPITFSALWIIPLLAMSSSVSALPQDGLVAAGQADFQNIDSHTLHITAKDKTIINYSSFDIGNGEAVKFIQPSTKSTVLNRVRGDDPSQIFGVLTANGRVFLVNPNGVYFGPNAR